MSLFTFITEFNDHLYRDQYETSEIDRALSMWLSSMRARGKFSRSIDHSLAENSPTVAESLKNVWIISMLSDDEFDVAIATVVLTRQ